MTVVILKLAGMTRGEMTWALELGAKQLLNDAQAFRRLVSENNQSHQGGLLSERAAAILTALMEAIQQGQHV